MKNIVELGITVERQDVSGWVELTAEDKAAVITQKAKATPSPKLFTLRDDGNNAEGHFAQFSREAVVGAANDSVSFLKTIGFVKS
jgi:hypothetical protein